MKTARAKEARSMPSLRVRMEPVNEVHDYWRLL